MVNFNLQGIVFNQMVTNKNDPVCSYRIIFVIRKSIRSCVLNRCRRRPPQFNPALRFANVFFIKATGSAVQVAGFIGVISAYHTLPGFWFAILVYRAQAVIKAFRTLLSFTSFRIGKVAHIFCDIDDIVLTSAVQAKNGVSGIDDGCGPVAIRTAVEIVG